MSLVEMLALGIALAMDAMAASVMLGLRVAQPRLRDAFRVGLTFGGFQALMPTLGYWLGQALYRFVAVFDHWVAFGLLTVLGMRMIRDARRDDGTLPESCADEALRPRTLIALAIATSIDALTVGVTLALDLAGLWLAVAVIGGVTLALCTLAFRLGGRIGRRFCGRTQQMGGAVLIVMGLHLLWQHLRS